jgi:hypothetical protein
MTQQPTTSQQAGSEPPSAWATGFIIFAAVMMMMSGAFQALAGLVALFEDEFYVATPNYRCSSTPPHGGGFTCCSACSW